jgi:hypothetical protein
VSKHTTCGDVDEGGVKRLVEVPGCQCLGRDDDVGMVVFGTNKARKNRNPKTHVHAQKFGAKRTHKSYQIDVKSGNMVLKRGVKTKSADVGGCIPVLPGLEASYFWSWR